MPISLTSVSTLADTRTPAVMFPAFHLTMLEVKDHKQTAFPD
ncbi:hypothetical protein [Methylobacter sp. YRD-M1]|nr:hypothetical protein [Methylobacter sp. YRD-M1]